MAKFDEMLKELHDKKGTVLTDAEANEPIVINSLRQFEVPKGYNLTIAYEGDVNSQKITFKLPRTHEGHDLADCSLKVIRWKNTNIKAEDSSNLKVINIDTTNIIVEWIVPPAAFVAAGNIEVAITFYDILNGSLAFSWNTAAFSGFKVEKTLSQVGKIPTNIAPAKNEILYIDEENHNIVAPNGYNFIVSTFGNRKTTKVYFQTTATVGGIPIIDNNTTVSVIASLNGESGTYDIPSTNIFPSFSTSEETGEGLVNFVWNVPTEITCNNKEYVGEFSIAIKIEHKEIQTTSETQTEDNTQVWKTVPFTKLTLAKSLFDSNAELLSDDYTTIVDAQLTGESLPERRVGGISLFKRGTAEYWKYGEGSNYKPYPGEPIIYLTDNTNDTTNSYRIKYGDGINLVKDLPFQSSVYVVQDEEELPGGYDIYIDPNGEAYKYELSEEEKDKITEKVVEQLPNYLPTEVAEQLPTIVEEQLPAIVEEQLPEFSSEAFVKKEESCVYIHRIHLMYNYTGGTTKSDGKFNVFFTLINNDPISYSFGHNWNEANFVAGTMELKNAKILKRLYQAIQITPGNPNVQNFVPASGSFITADSTKLLCTCTTVSSKYHHYNDEPNPNKYKRLLVIRGTAPNIKLDSVNNLFKQVVEVSCGSVEIESGKESDIIDNSGEIDCNEFTSQPITCFDEVVKVPTFTALQNI